ncbi:SMP-30/gluconolactonase/LRE family protein [Aliikangiella maris]|uniref:SMP-30/gluconolactonase/LRE family protein n=2 Tax=Aliikangiella maris TaxID=3162458 RepID=A0ABV3MR53_9GAMM
MYGASKTLTAEKLTQLPQSLFYRGEPTEWVKVTRPGEELGSFIEGAAYDCEGNLWCVDVPYGRIFSITNEGKWQTQLTYEGEPHCLALHPDKGFLISDYRQGLLHFLPVNLAEKQPNRSSSLKSICTGINSENFRGLADVTIDHDNQIWFTDPGRSSLSDPTGRLFCLTGNGKIQTVLNNIPYPNGIAISADNQFIYLAVTRANAIWRLRRNAPDPLHPMTGCFIQLSGGLGPDGLAVNNNGLLAVAQAQAGRVWIFDPLGDLIAKIQVPEGLWTTSVAFHPHQNNLLSILEAQTASIYQIDLNQI